MLEAWDSVLYWTPCSCFTSYVKSVHVLLLEGWEGKWMDQFMHAYTILAYAANQTLSFHWFHITVMSLWQLTSRTTLCAFTVPVVPTSCNITLLYKSTGRLEHIVSTWKSLSVSHMGNLWSTFLAKCSYSIWYCTSPTSREGKDQTKSHLLPPGPS